MNILTISAVEWDDKNALGNTFSNFFYGLEGCKFASIYKRHTLPDNKVCNLYYQITEFSIIRNFLHRERIGKEFQKFLNVNNVPSQEPKQKNNEKKIISSLQRLGINKLANACSTFLLKTRLWDNKKFENFIRTFDPDVVFTTFIGTEDSLLIYEGIKKICPKCKFVGFMTDGVTFNDKKRRILGKQIATADKVYGISRAICEDAKRLYNKKVSLLRKGVDFKNTVERFPSSRDYIEIVYAGNLHRGRDKVLLKLVEEIEKFNQKSPEKIRLEIYSATSLPRKEIETFNRNDVSTFHPACSFDKLKRILAQTDVVLHVESFEPKNIKIVKLSFSTKIVDGLQSGAALMAIGPQGVSSIEEIREIPGTLLVDDLNKLPLSLEEIVNSSLEERALKTREYAEQRFNIKDVQKQLLEDFHKLTNN